MPSVHGKLLHLAVKRRPANAEQGCGLRDIAIRAGKNAAQRRALRFRKIGTAIVTLLLQNIRSWHPLRDGMVIELQS
jgi:hypothetical protein